MSQRTHVIGNPVQWLGPELDWKPEYLVASSWLEHIPFAFWLINAVRPRCLVELGTHYGASYFAFCQAVARLEISSRCYAVDTWEGDAQAGAYGHEVFDAVSQVNRQKYSAFSSLLRMRFDEARSYFQDGEVDVLHIDGFHTYEAVSNDFATWKSTLSTRGVVLFHDINVRERDFGVWRFWKEITEDYPHFTFHHGFGLGVVAVGEEVPKPILDLCACDEESGLANAVRMAFSFRGEATLNAYRLLEYREQVNDLFRKEGELVTKSHQDEVRYQEKIQELEITIQNLYSSHAVEVHKKDQIIQEIEGRWDAIRRELDQLYCSRSWRLTAPLRFGRNLTSRIARRVLGRFNQVRLAINFRLETMFRQTSRIAHRDLRRLHQVLLAMLFRLETMFRQTQTPGSGRDSLPVARRLRVVWVGGEPDTPGYHYRVVMPALSARAGGADVTFCRLDAIDAHQEAIASSDVVVLWRAPWDDAVARLFWLARQAGATICFDLDDLMCDCRLATIQVIDGIRSQGLKEEQVGDFYARIHRSMEAADLCLATTPELAGHMRAFGKPTSVIPNGFDEAKFLLSRQAARRRLAAGDDGLLRIGYAGGSKTHQRDFSLCVQAVVRILRDFDRARLVLFRCPQGTPLVDVHEYPELVALEDRIEWRQTVPVAELPNELARFDINLAPVEVGNFFCEAKSELKFFEAALAGVCTVASPTGPFSRAIRHGETGYLAADEVQWHAALVELLSDREFRLRMAKQALREALWPFGPERRSALIYSFLEQVRGGRAASRAFALDLRQDQETPPALNIPESEVLFAHDRLGQAAVTVIVPLYNYADFIAESLDSVAAQTESDLDLIVVDDASTDNSSRLAVDWAKAHTDRFNRVLVLKNRHNSKLGPTRNVGFDAAETPYILPLDADNILLPDCVSTCLETMRRTGAAFVYPKIEAFGDKQYLMGEAVYAPHRFVGGNYIDAMALIAKSVWCAVGGYLNVPHGWEDYEFWCRIVELGLHGQPAGGPVLAKYRVHGASMLTNSTHVPENFSTLVRYIQERHPWLNIATDTVGTSLVNKQN